MYSVNGQYDDNVAVQWSDITQKCTWLDFAYHIDNTQNYRISDVNWVGKNISATQGGEGMDTVIVMILSEVDSRQSW